MRLSREFLWYFSTPHYVQWRVKHLLWYLSDQFNIAMEVTMEAAMDTVTMDTATPDVEILSRNLYTSLDPSLSNDERATVYQVSN